MAGEWKLDNKEGLMFRELQGMFESDKPVKGDENREPKAVETKTVFQAQKKMNLVAHVHEKSGWVSYAMDYTGRP